MKRFLEACGWAALVALLHTALFRWPQRDESWGEALEMRVLDLWFNLRGPIAPPDDVVVVAMDEDSYQELNYPKDRAWPRAAHVKLLQRLAETGARRVVFDVEFFDPGPSAAVDDQLAEAMRRVPTIIAAGFEEKNDLRYRKPSLLWPLAKFRDVAHVGWDNVIVEGGRVRRFLVPTRSYRSDMIGDIPSLASAASGTSQQPGPGDLIHYYGPPRSIRTYSYYQLLDPEVPLPAAKITNKVVFVGKTMQTAPGSAEKDTFQTPYSPEGDMFGVEIQATAAANLLRGDWIRRGSAGREQAFLAGIAGLLTLALLYLRPVWGAILVLAYAAGWSSFAYGSFLRGIFVPGAVLAVIVLPLTYLKATLTNYLITRLQQLRLERAFRFYLSPEMAREVALNPQALRLGGQEMECTALFTDIAGFTATVESMRPEEVGRMLNAYFTEVMDAILDNRGTLIKFVGDAVYALWGAPIKTPDHARLCCEAALAIDAEIERFNQSGRFPPLHTRFGINTGAMLAGNLGSARRFDFTGIGDAVNLASRVEGLNKYFGTTILVTDSTRAQLPVNMVSLKLGLIRVAGKNRPVGLHALFRRPVSEAVAAQWIEACAGFVRRDWESAGALFASVGREESLLAGAAELYRHQIELHQLTPPPGDWQGEIIFTWK